MMVMVMMAMVDQWRGWRRSLGLAIGLLFWLGGCLRLLLVASMGCYVWATNLGLVPVRERERESVTNKFTEQEENGIQLSANAKMSSWSP